MLKNVYVAGGVRTPFGAFNGALSALTAPELGSTVIKQALKRANVDPKEVDEVLFGNVLGAGIGQNPARQAALGAGLGPEVGATTINKVCGSSSRTVVLAAQAIQCGDAGLIVAGGCESMTNAPYLLRKARQGYRMGHGELIDSMIRARLPGLSTFSSRWALTRKYEPEERPSRCSTSGAWRRCCASRMRNALRAVPRR